MEAESLSSSSPSVQSWCRYSLKLIRHREEPPELAGQRINPRRAAAYLHEVIEGTERELFGALLLNAQGHAIGYTLPFKGGLTRAAVEPRALLQRALLANAASMLLFHNHPSGSLAPSPEDIQFTHRMILAGALVGVTILDHLILGEPPHYASVVGEAGLTTDIEPFLKAGEWALAAPLRARPLDRRRQVRPKYRHPLTGETWSGRGRMANWLVQALAGGATLEAFRVNPMQESKQ